mmetsp:Transcript_10294/g.25190  ORF Transcript_10294/g.25190 Transcript_10294/m.25190 type:complete len:211 (+) Transcript_10294:547-1179(+)
MAVLHRKCMRRSAAAPPREPPTVRPPERKECTIAAPFGLVLLAPSASASAARKERYAYRDASFSDWRRSSVCNALLGARDNADDDIVVSAAAVVDPSSSSSTTTDQNALDPAGYVSHTLDTSANTSSRQSGLSMTFTATGPCSCAVSPSPPSSGTSPAHSPNCLCCSLSIHSLWARFVSSSSHSCRVMGRLPVEPSASTYCEANSERVAK